MGVLILVIKTLVIMVLVIPNFECHWQGIGDWKMQDRLGKVS